MAFKTIVIQLFLLLIFYHAECQVSRIDSLRTLIEGKEGREKANLLYELGRQYLRFDQNISAAVTALEGYRIAKTLNDSLMIIENGRVMAMALRLHGEIDSAIIILERILPLSRKYENSPPHLSILNNLALAYTFTAEYDKALELHFQYLEGNRRNRNIGGETIALNNIGLVYYKLKDYSRARLFFSDAIVLKKKRNDSYDLGVAYINLGLCEAYLGDYSNAKLSIKAGIQISGNNASDLEVVCADFAMGVVYFGLKEYLNAERYFLKSYLLAKHRDYQRFQFDNVDYLTQIYLMQNRFTDASYYLNEAETLIRAGVPYNLEVIKIYSRFFEMYNKMKNYERAAFYQQKYIQLKDSLYDEELTINLVRVEADYRERENRARIATQEQVLLLKEDVIKKQRILNLVISVLVLVASAFAIVLWKNYSKKKKYSALLRESVRVRNVEVNVLEHELITHNELVEQGALDIKNALATIQELCKLSHRDVNDPAACQYIDQIEKASMDMGNDLKLLFHIKGDIENADRKNVNEEIK